MAALPTEIIAEILCRLPVKSLFRFLCVSKSWFSLIKNPKFIKQHLNQTLNSNSHRHLLLTYSSLSSSLINRQFKFSKLPHPLKLKSPEKKPKILFWGSCNGVICISDADRNDIVLFNPTTKTYRKLPKTKYPYPNEFAVFGLGYDAESGDYKVLRLMQCVGPDDGVLNDARVYSFKRNSWKRVKDIPYNLIFDRNHGVFVNGGLHYVVSKVPFQSEYKSIARFDVRTEQYSLLECPDYDHSLRCWTMYLGDLGGRLSCSVNFDLNGCGEVWMMDDYGKKESWIRLLGINKKEACLIDIKAITWCNDGNMILVMVDGELRWYDMRRGRAMRAGVLEGLPGEGFETGVFLESLVMLNEDKMKDEVKTGAKTIAQRDEVKTGVKAVAQRDEVKTGEGTTAKKDKKKYFINLILITIDRVVILFFLHSWL